MTEISLDGLNTLIAKAKELKKILQENPEILEYMRLAEKFSDAVILPIPTDRLVRAGEAAKILGVNPAKISEYADKKILTKLYVDGSSHSKFWLSEVKAVAKNVEWKN